MNNCLIATVSWLVFFVTLGFISAKEHPLHSKQNKPFYFPKYRPEIFYDNKVFPENIEVDVFVFKNQLQRLFYVMEGGYRPLSVTVTPCARITPLQWRLSHQPPPASSSVASSIYHKDPWYNHVVLPQPAISASPSATYSGTERRSYTNPRAPPGLYTLELDSDVTMRAKVVVTTRSCTEYSYHPPLPTTPEVQIVKTKRNRVLISWKPSSSPKPVEYCVTSNTAGNYDSFCAANSDSQKDYQITPPPSSGFGFHWEKAARRTIVSNFVSEIPKNNVTLFCVGRKTWHMFRGLERGLTYYFDVFAIDIENNASTAYVGAKASIKSSSKLSFIKDDSLVTFTLDSHNGYAATAKYHEGKNSNTVLIFVQSCTGPGPVLFSVAKVRPGRKAQEILSERVMDVKTLEIPRLMIAVNGSSSYVFNIKSTTQMGRKVRMWISDKKQAFPFPVLPDDKNVKVFDTLITCNSITIGWKASTDERVKYCIYRSAAQDELTRKTLGEPQNFCQPPKDDSKTTRTNVLCRRYHRFSKRRFNNVIMQKVKGLEPDMTYLFEVQVTKVKGKMLPYEQVWASTRETCTHSRDKR